MNGTYSNSRFYTVSEAARVLEVSPSTIWRWVEAGRLSAYRLGPKSIRIRKKDIEEVIQPARSVFGHPSPAEIRRRKALVTQMLNHRKKRLITPLTTADLIRIAREEKTFYDKAP